MTSGAAHGTYTQNLVGEFAGDLIGTSTLILAEAVAPEKLHDFTRAARRWIDPFYDKLAHGVIPKDCPDAEYEKKIDEWKTFQERNLVRSAIMGVTGIAGNVAIQKWLMKNPSPTSIILASKVVCTALTTGVNLAARFAFPKQMNSMDKWMGDTFFKPMMDTQGESSEASSEMSHVERLSQKKSSELQVTAR